MRCRHADGFTLVEVMLALAVLTTGAGTLLYAAMAAGRATVDARRADVMQRAAVEKLEQLRSLAWTSDAGIVPVSDWSSDVTTSPLPGTGGSGLGVSPGDTLATSVDGYADVLDADGRWLGGGAAVPPGAAMVRRWSIQTAAAPADTLVLQVVVVPFTSSGAVPTAAAARGANGTWLIDLRTRRSR